MHEVLLRVFDDGDFLASAGRRGDHHRLTPGWTGETVGVVANQPMHVGGDRQQASDKAARVQWNVLATRSTSRWCSSWTHPGFCPRWNRKERDHQARWEGFLYAVVEADVPR